MLNTFCEGAFINPYSKIFTTTYFNCSVLSLLKILTSDRLSVLKLPVKYFYVIPFFIFRLVIPQLLLLKNLPLCCHGDLQVQKMNVMDFFFFLMCNSEEAFLLPREGTDFVRQKNWPGFFTLLHIIASDSNRLGPDKKALKL